MIRQLHYTSTETGPDGVQGFQVTASTPGIPARHEDLAIALSAYRPPPAFPLVPSDDDIRRSPVRFGYLPTDDAVYLFQSRYIGTDFTGRQGNYFAHALVLDSRDLLGDTLPVDLWASPVWAGRSSPARTLPAVTALPAGPLADLVSLREFLLGDGRLDRLAVLLGAVQGTLARQRGRVVLVCPDTDQAARWLAAVLCSLPRQVAVQTSFTTYSPAPTDDEFTLVATTPDVRVTPRPYDPHLTVDLAGGARDDLGPTPVDSDSGLPSTTAAGPPAYAVAVARAWRASVDDVVELTGFVTRQWSQIGLDRLDLAGAAWCLARGRPLEGLSLPATAAFAIKSLPRQVSASLWKHLGQALQTGDAITDPAEWAPLLEQARAERLAVPPEMESGYVIAVLTSLARSPRARAGAAAATGSSDAPWLPDLRQPHLDTVVSNWLRTMARAPSATTASQGQGQGQGQGKGQGQGQADVGVAAARRSSWRAAAIVAVRLSGQCSPQEQNRIATELGPLLLDGPADAVWTSLRALPADSAVLTGVAAVFAARLRPTDGLATVTKLLSSTAVKVLGRAQDGQPMLAIALLLASARLGETDEVEALRTITRRGRPPVQAKSVARFADLVWSDRVPTATQACALLELIQESCVGSVADTALPNLFIEILISDAESRDGLTDDDGRLAHRLYQDEELIGSMSQGATEIAEAVYFGWYFRGGTAPKAEAARAAARAVRMYPQLAKVIGGWLLDGVAGWLIQTRDADFHLAQLEALDAMGGTPFRTAYVRRAEGQVRSAPPKDLALLVPVWFASSRGSAIGLHLMNEVLPTELAGRRRRDLDEVTTALRLSRRELQRLSDALDPVWKDDWGRWWEHWRAGHSKSLLGRLRRSSGRR